MRIWERELVLLPSEPAQGGHGARIRHIPGGLKERFFMALDIPVALRH